MGNLHCLILRVYAYRKHACGMFLADTAGAMLRGVAPQKRLRMYPYCTLKTEQRKHECKSKATEGTSGKLDVNKKAIIYKCGTLIIN